MIMQVIQHNLHRPQ